MQVDGVELARAHERDRSEHSRRLTRLRVGEAELRQDGLGPRPQAGFDEQVDVAGRSSTAN